MLDLARTLGINEADMVHIRRGSLLHDIGKIGIPDAILHKPGPLSDEEWRIMRRHPEHAVELLAPFDFLQPALDIPYCHHERWDGTGYPRGLKGEQIPLAARAFAAVDIRDALVTIAPTARRGRRNGSAPTSPRWLGRTWTRTSWRSCTRHSGPTAIRRGSSRPVETRTLANSLAPKAHAIVRVSMQCVVELLGSPEGRPALRSLLRPHRHGVPRRTPSHSSGGVPGITTPSA